jgi:23S rRNA (uracil1939-C5)-methyltransferase
MDRSGVEKGAETPLICKHFGTCGGCAFQDLAEDAYRSRKRAQVADALRGHGIEASVDDVKSVPPHSRRRATLKVAKLSGAAVIGFHAASSHRIVDMRECRVLTPNMLAMVQALRDLMHDVLREGEKADLNVTETETGFDILLKWPRKPGSDLIVQTARWSDRRGIARIVSGNEIVVSLAPPTVSLAGVSVKIPPGAFLQPTIEGEIILQSLVHATLSRFKNIVDLFAGCGTFTFALAGQARVRAVDSDMAMLNALAEASRQNSGLKQISTERRNLFKHPLQPSELSGHDAVILDPPRAGANAQVRALAEARIPKIVYVSCDAGTFGRDAAVLLHEGYRISSVTPVDQFLWSEHIELVSSFELPG